MSKFMDVLRGVRNGTIKVPPHKKVWCQPQLSESQVEYLLKRIEKEVSKEAKLAVMMYLPVYVQEAAFYLFCSICAKHYGLNGIEMDNCGRIMAQFGMLELEHWDDKDWMFVIDRFPEFITVNGKKLHPSSKVDWSVCSPNRAAVGLHAKWSEEYGLGIAYEDIERFEGTNIVLKDGPKER